MYQNAGSTCIINAALVAFHGYTCFVLPTFPHCEGKKISCSRTQYEHPWTRGFREREMTFQRIVVEARDSLTTNIDQVLFQRICISAIDLVNGTSPIKLRSLTCSLHYPSLIVPTSFVPSLAPSLQGEAERLLFVSIQTC